MLRYFFLKRSRYGHSCTIFHQMKKDFALRNSFYYRNKKDARGAYEKTAVKSHEFLKNFLRKMPIELCHLGMIVFYCTIIIFIEWKHKTLYRAVGSIFTR